MTKAQTNHAHLAWAIDSRMRNQKCCLKLLQLFDEHPPYWNSIKKSRAAQEILAVAFSLWRAAFLAEKTGKRNEVFKHGREFLAKVIEDNAIAYIQDKNSREWTFNYYTRSARYSLEFLAKYWPGFPVYVHGTRKPVERWNYCQQLFEDGVEFFRLQIKSEQDRRKQKSDKYKRKMSAKKKRRKVRAMKAAGQLP